ncbi:MAG: LysR family transcriptional regulator [Deltaproteobacteria bacterium]|nr:MAG: LysR family transcriptional regulator [Deltaproteobacteria bacterium]
MRALTELSFFVVVAEEGGFTTAAQVLGVSRSYVSRVVAALEARLGTRLLQRSTRVVTLTEAGRSLLAEVGPALAAIDQAQIRVQEAQRQLRGPIRASVPAAFGRRYLLQPLLEFQRRHEQVELDLHLSEDKVDVLAGRYDLVVRGGEMVSSSLVARRLCGFRVILAAAPAYVQRHGTPTAPGDLADHACLRYTGNRHPGRWRLPVDGAEVTVEVGGPLLSNDLDLLVQGAIEGLGILYLPDFLLVPHLVDGSLVPLLPGCARTEAFYLVTPHRSPVPARVSRLSAHLLEATRGWDWSLNQSQPRGAPAPQA